MSYNDPLMGSTTSTDQAIRALRTLLRGDGRTVDERWRAWARELINMYELSPHLISGLWQEVLDFDRMLASYVAEPVPLDFPAVIVAGSGKETFKTFNVSTAASILAAASGAYVVKGVSRSVSAVSGSADVLDVLGLPISDMPGTVPQTLERDRIAFISYSAFCPTYAGRYDGVFPFLSPFSFFMPVAVLGVSASSFVYGIAHTNVSLAAEAIRMVRPDFQRGIVVATELSQQEMMDEQASYGISYTAVLDGTHPRVFRGAHPPAPESWRAAVAHRSSHQDNAALLTSSLAPDGCAACAELVDRNAALILASSQWGKIDEVSALARVRNVRLAGGAVRLLTELQDREGVCRAS
jgi:anthranilate phosphoribosyltransferase